MKLNLSQRIASGYFILIFLTGLTGCFTLVKIYENKNKYEELTQSILPFTNYLHQLTTGINSSHTNLQLLIYGHDEGKKLSIIAWHNEGFQKVKSNLRLSLTNETPLEISKGIYTILKKYEQVIKIQALALEELSKQSSVENPQSLYVYTTYTKNSSPILSEINAEMGYLFNYQERIMQKKESDLAMSNTFLCRSLLGLMVLTLIIGISSTLVTTRLLKRPINYLKKTILAMSKGEIPEIKKSDRKDEVGLINNAFVELTESLKTKGSFAVEIGKGNYNHNFKLLSNRDELGNALVEMNKNLRLAAEEAQCENWLKNGIAQMSEILRNEHSNTGGLYANIISFISKYMVMNQGMLYLVKEDRDKIKYLEMVAGFACDKNNALNKRVYYHEGYVGQVATGKKLLTINDVPVDYFQVNSGLGSALPKHIIITPLIFEDELQGVIELASFTEFNALQVNLLEKLSGIIAATFDLITRKLNTELLLFESQNLNDKLIEQENDLKKSNEDLVEKGKQLRVSEEELREQQEELMQTNTQLEEKAQLLAEQNEEISFKNEQLEVAKEAIRIKAEELENTSRYKSEFLANMSHELRTPLNSILILSNLLSENKERNLNEKQVEYARVVKRSGADLLSLINDILDLSKLESRNIELEITNIRLKELGHDIESLFKEFAIEKEVTFQVNYGDDLPEYIHSDKMRIEQIIKNLLSNAFKFTSKNGSVTLGLYPAPKNQQYNSTSIDTTKSMIRLDVCDTGIGIPVEKQQLIFEAFKQADGSTSRKYGGTGLGLSISKELSALLGGEIQISSTLGLGSVFSLFIPVSIGENAFSQDDNAIPGTREIESAKKEIKPDKVDQEKADVTSKNALHKDRLILIIEDDEDFAKILLNYATKKGFTGMIANRGDTGLINAKRFKPDAIILDINLPGMDGWSVMRRIKEDPEIANIPVHIMSGHNNPQNPFLEGTVEVWKKPINFEELDKVFETLNKNFAGKFKRILIIEDNAEQNDSIRALFENTELNCFSAFNGKDALAKLEVEPFDLITLDLSLPDISGFDLLKQIKGMKNCSDIPVIIYTGKNLTIEENRELKKYSNSIILKTERSFERLVDETNLFLNKLDEGCEADRQQKKLKQKNGLTQITNPPTLDYAPSQQSEKPVVIQGTDKEVDKTKCANINLKGKKVLVVDDDIRNIFAMTSILEQQECIIVVANDGKEALAMLANNPDTDIVLMDIMMPEMDGYEAMKQIRLIDKFNTMPIVALTAKAMKGDKEKCMEAGATDYLSKPLDASKLMTMMHILMYQ